MPYPPPIIAYKLDKLFPLPPTIPENAPLPLMILLWPEPIKLHELAARAELPLIILEEPLQIIELLEYWSLLYCPLAMTLFVAGPNGIEFDVPQKMPALLAREPMLLLVPPPITPEGPFMILPIPDVITPNELLTWFADPEKIPLQKPLAFIVLKRPLSIAEYCPATVQLCPPPIVEKTPLTTLFDPLKIPEYAADAVLKIPPEIIEAVPVEMVLFEPPAIAE